MTIKRILVAIFSLILTLIVYILIQLYVNNIEKNCLYFQFDKEFEKENSIVLNKIYNFSKILNCKSWDKVIIVGGPDANRVAIFLKEGIFLPEIDYKNRISGCLLIYLIEDGKLVAPPIEFWVENFLYFNDFNAFDYVSLNRQDAVFKCTKLETVGKPLDILTFELIK